MSDAVDTGSGIIVGTDPRGEPVTAADLIPPDPQQVPSQVRVQNGNGNGNGQPQGQRMFSEEEVGRIREEEKSKLYDRLNSVQDELKSLREEREAREKAATEAQAAADEAARKLQEEEMSVRQLVEKKEQEWGQRFSQLEEERERDRALFEQERRYAQLSDYRRDRVEQEAEYIMPELRDLITGNSELDVDNSIEEMKRRTAAILANVQAQQPRGPAAPLRGSAPTGQPPVGPMEQQTGIETLTTEQIRNMDPKTYSKYRDSLLAAASQQRRQG